MAIFLQWLAAVWEQKQDTLRDDDVWPSGRISLGSPLGCGPVLSFGRPGQKHPSLNFRQLQSHTDLNLRCHGNGFWKAQLLLSCQAGLKLTLEP